MNKFLWILMAVTLLIIVILCILTIYLEINNPLPASCGNIYFLRIFQNISCGGIFN